MGTIREAKDKAAAMRWRGTRNEKPTIAQAETVVSYFEGTGVHDLDDITTDHINAMVHHFQRSGTGSSSIKRKMAVLNVMCDVGLQAVPPLATRRVPTFRVRQPRVLKWWLRPEDQARLTVWLRAQGDELMADYVDFVCFTGLRVEEALRVDATMFTGLDTAKPCLLVPGIKTDGSQKMLPILPEVVEVVKRRISAAPRIGGRAGMLFPVSYFTLRDKWSECRDYLGYGHIHTATLRALRRSFARIASERGMPTEILRDYLRHSNIATTAGYLQLVGGYDAEMMRQWL